MNRDQGRLDRGGRDELELTALRYVLREAEAGELADFEQRLATDQEAREAVERAVLLCDAVEGGAAAPRPVMVGRVGGGRRALAVAAAVLLAVGASWWVLEHRETGAAPSPPVAGPEGELLHLWVALGEPEESAEVGSLDQPDDRLEDELVDPKPPEGGREGSEPDDESASEEFGPDEIPTWMWTALESS